MTLAGKPKAGGGISVEGKLINGTEPQKNSETGGPKSFWGYGEHTKLKTRRMADIHLRNTQTPNFLYFITAIAHAIPT